jgi:hypothetical protein
LIACLSVDAANLFDKIYLSECAAQLADNGCVYGLRQ